MQKFNPRITSPFYALYFYLLLFFSIAPGMGYAQHTYELRYAKDIPLLSAGVAGTTSSILLRARNKPLTVEDIGQLNASDIFAIDRSAAMNYGSGARTASDIFLLTSYVFPLTTLLIPDIRSEPGTIAVMLAETMLINEAFTGITKALVKRPRPFTYNQDVPENIRTSAASNYSFFSGHTSYTAALSFFTAKVIADNIDNNTTEALVWTSAALWPAATGYFRYKAGMHFPTDVIVGYLVGAATGYLIPQLHKTKTEEQTSKAHVQGLQVTPTMVRFVVRF